MTYEFCFFKLVWVYKYVKVKCTPVQALRLCTGRTAHRGSRGITLPFHDHDTRSWWGASVTPRPLFTPGKDPVPVQEAGWAPGLAWAGAENLAPTGIRSPDRPARSESLYRLSYRGPLSSMYLCINLMQNVRNFSEQLRNIGKNSGLLRKVLFDQF